MNLINICIYCHSLLLKKIKIVSLLMQLNAQVHCALTWLIKITEASLENEWLIMQCRLLFINNVACINNIFNASYLWIFRWGFFVASHPLKCILVSLVFTAVCSIGMLNFKLESRPDRLWIPRDSEFARTYIILLYFCH